MTAVETITFPDAVAVCVLYGEAALIAGGDTETLVNARVTNDERQVTLELTDAEIHDRVVQRSTIKCEVRTGDGPLAQQQAQDLGQLMRGLFGAMEGTIQAGATIYKVRDAQGLADLPDEKTGNPRYVFFFSISMRGGATLDPSTTVTVPDWMFQGVLSVEPGTNVTVDDTDPQHPVVSASGGGGSGIVESVVAGTNITVDDTDPANPIVASTGGPGLPDPWTADQVDGNVVATVADPTKTALEIVAAEDQEEPPLIITSDTELGSIDLLLIRQSVGKGGGDLASIDDSGQFDLHVLDPGADGLTINEQGPVNGSGMLLSVNGSMENRGDAVAVIETTETGGVAGASAKTYFNGGLKFQFDFGVISLVALDFDVLNGVTTWRAQPGQTLALVVVQDENGDPVARVLPSGAIGTSSGEPADAAINPGECFRWFDATNGAARIGYKGKTLDGTVVFAYGPMGP